MKYSKSLGLDELALVFRVHLCELCILACGSPTEVPQYCNISSGIRPRVCVIFPEVRDWAQWSSWRPPWETSSGRSLTCFYVCQMLQDRLSPALETSNPFSQVPASTAACWSSLSPAVALCALVGAASHHARPSGRSDNKNKIGIVNTGLYLPGLECQAVIGRFSPSTSILAWV